MVARTERDVSARAAARGRHLLWLAAIVATGKLLIMLSISAGAWLGADGESYTAQVDSLWKSGLFVQGLNYWPAGYALTLWVLSWFGHGAMLWLLSIVQTLVWSFVVWLLSREILNTRVAWAALPLAYLALLNPTLSLASLTVGYETLAGAMQLIAVALLLRDVRGDERQPRWLLPVAGAALGYSIALQPRLIL